MRSTRANSRTRSRAMNSPQATATSSDRLLRLREVIEITGIGKTMIYRLMHESRFPQQYKPGGYASRWSESEIIAWRESQRKEG